MLCSSTDQHAEHAQKETLSSARPLWQEPGRQRYGTKQTWRSQDGEGGDGNDDIGRLWHIECIWYIITGRG